MSELFAPTGLHVMAGGQFGSEGKGALAAWLACQAMIDDWPCGGVITSAGPNSGHTSYFSNEKIVLKQLPTFAVHSHLYGRTIPVYFSAGSIIDAEILMGEHHRFLDIPIYIHPCATVVLEKDKVAEMNVDSTIFQVAGTRSGTGAALARKIQRDPSSIYYNHSQRLFPYYEYINNLEFAPYFMEISQGFSLGINEAKFYPKVTSRECTFMQGMADSRIPARHYQRGYLCFRTYPIRVGNADGYNSGDWYADQSETTWEALGLTPEYTTVTKRVRRVATFSWNQFRESVSVNAPTHVFLNYMNYKSDGNQILFYEQHRSARHELNGDYEFIFGYGPRVGDIKYKDTTGTPEL